VPTFADRGVSHKIIEVVNGVLVDYMRHCCFHHNGDLNDDYTQLMTPGTQCQQKLQ
jgi:hypothetical protein